MHQIALIVAHHDLYLNKVHPQFESGVRILAGDFWLRLVGFCFCICWWNVGFRGRCRRSGALAGRFLGLRSCANRQQSKDTKPRNLLTELPLLEKPERGPLPSPCMCLKRATLRGWDSPTIGLALGGVKRGEWRKVARISGLCQVPRND